MAKAEKGLLSSESTPVGLINNQANFCDACPSQVEISYIIHAPLGLYEKQVSQPLHLYIYIFVSYANSSFSLLKCSSWLFICWFYAPNLSSQSHRQVLPFYVCPPVF